MKVQSVDPFEQFIANMSDEEFAAFWAGVKEEASASESPKAKDLIATFFYASTKAEVSFHIPQPSIESGEYNYALAA